MPRSARDTRNKPCNCRAARNSHIGTIAIPSPALRLCCCQAASGLPDLFYLHFERFAEHYSVITFDYQEQFTTNAKLARAVASLLDGLDEHVWLVGQSLGGVIAQIVAKFHPERIEGLVLSNTCSLARDMGQEARDELMSMVENQRTWKRRLQLIPMPVFRRLMAWAVMRKTRDLSAEERRLMQGLCDALQQLLNKQYQRRMWDCSIA